MIAFSPDQWHAHTPSAALGPTRPKENTKKSDGPLRKSYAARVMDLFKSTAKEWVRDRCPQLGAALAFYTVFSLAPLVIVLLGVFGVIYGSNQGAREKILEQLRYYLDPSGVRAIQDIAISLPADSKRLSYCDRSLGLVARSQLHFWTIAGRAKYDLEYQT